MKQPPITFSQPYHRALRTHLSKRARPDRETVKQIVNKAKSEEIRVLDIAKVHERFLVMDLLPSCAEGRKATLIRRSGEFFAAVVAASSVAKTAAQDGARVNMIGSLIGHSVELAAANRKLDLEVLRCGELKAESGVNKTLVRNISLTQKMVEKPATTVQKFAFELRPAVLDDLGLIPALQSFMTDFTNRTGVHTYLTVFKGVEKINSVNRTILYRVTQEALNNVRRHAQASRFEVSIRRQPRSVRMEAVDDGESFQIRQLRSPQAGKPPGLLGMRERVEMVGGSFRIKSAQGEGTLIIANIPVSESTVKKWQDDSDENPPEKP